MEAIILWEKCGGLDIKSGGVLIHGGAVLIHLIIAPTPSLQLYWGENASSWCFEA